jgi:hypothetical protein
MSSFGKIGVAGTSKGLLSQVKVNVHPRFPVHRIGMSAAATASADDKIGADATFSIKTDKIEKIPLSVHTFWRSKK